MQRTARRVGGPGGLSCGGSGLGGGTAGTKYKITVRLTTTSGLVKESDFELKVKEV